jgi:hypothetical protein
MKPKKQKNKEAVMVWLPDQGENEKDARVRYARDIESLVIKAAEESYSSDHLDPIHFEETVKIKLADGTIKTFIVTAEVNIDFYAEEQK